MDMTVMDILMAASYITIYNRAILILPRITPILLERHNMVIHIIQTASPTVRHHQVGNMDLVNNTVSHHRVGNIDLVSSTVRHPVGNLDLANPTVRQRNDHRI
jgi:hypothetical protein